MLHFTSPYAQSKVITSHYILFQVPHEVSNMKAAMEALLRVDSDGGEWKETTIDSGSECIGSFTLRYKDIVAALLRVVHENSQHMQWEAKAEYVPKQDRTGSVVLDSNLRIVMTRGISCPMNGDAMIEAQLEVQSKHGQDTAVLGVQVGCK